MVIPHRPRRDAWTRQRQATPEECAARERILGWAAAYVPDRD
jgi:hypothetical protein